MIGQEIIIKATNQKGRVVGQTKGFWIVEFPNKRTTLVSTNKIKTK